MTKKAGGTGLGNEKTCPDTRVTTQHSNAHSDLAATLTYALKKYLTYIDTTFTLDHRVSKVSIETIVYYV